MKVSCIMPTGGRRRYVPCAIESFLAQTYDDRELVIFDECEESTVADLVPNDRRIRYYRKRGDRSLTLGDLRNMACDLASGQLIAHWDDDDYSVPSRLEDQVARLLQTGADLTGYWSMLFVDQRPGGQVWKFGVERDYVLGTSFLYRRAFWHRHPFQKRDTGEDNHFFDDEDDPDRPKLAAAEGWLMQAARIHSANTAAKAMSGIDWFLQDDPAIVDWGRSVLKTAEL